MRRSGATTVAVVAILLTPMALLVITAWRWHGGRCAGALHGSVWLLLLFAAGLATTRNPLRAVAACIAYLPIGYLFAVEPCTAPRSQGAGGLIYVISPLFIAFVIASAFLGGAILCVLVGGFSGVTEPPATEANPQRKE